MGNAANQMEGAMSEAYAVSAEIGLMNLRIPV